VPCGDSYVSVALCFLRCGQRTNADPAWSTQGVESGGVDAGLLTFMNHGCNGTYNYGIKLNFTEQDIDLGIRPRDIGLDDEMDVYNPFETRRFPNWGCQETAVALHDVEAGQEVLDNYLVHGTQGADDGDASFRSSILELKMWCSGEMVGLVTAYENDMNNIESHQG